MALFTATLVDDAVAAAAATGQPGRQRALLRRLSAPVRAVHADVRLPPGRLGAREEATSEAARAGEMRLTYARVNPGIRKYALPESTSAPSGSTGLSYLWIQELSRAERSFVHRLDLAGRARTSTRTRCLSTPSVLIFLSLVLIKYSAERGAAGGFPY